MEDFLKNIRDDHHNFDKGQLNDHIGNDPLDFFHEWYKDAFQVEQPESVNLKTLRRALHNLQQRRVKLLEKGKSTQTTDRRIAWYIQDIADEQRRNSTRNVNQTTTQIINRNVKYENWKMYFR